MVEAKSRFWSDKKEPKLENFSYQITGLKILKYNEHMLLPRGLHPGLRYGNLGTALPRLELRSGQ